MGVCKILHTTMKIKKRFAYPHKTSTRGKSHGKGSFEVSQFSLHFTVSLIRINTIRTHLSNGVRAIFELLLHYPENVRDVYFETRGITMMGIRECLRNFFENIRVFFLLLSSGVCVVV